ncbi:unnamed protein product [Plutella xylostella]|uniref:(diamondback moth) hypothetical protein n=1 Tax=Plutella xylostella TaxID=51655 RepID=A0A8S4FEX6_PLUXY|nr:unnamed protein product [Plutella xylostella]
MHLLCSDITGPHIFNMKFLVLLAACVVVAACSQGADAAPAQSGVSDVQPAGFNNGYTGNGNSAQASVALSDSPPVTSEIPAEQIGSLLG